MTKSERRMEVALMRAANQKAGMKLKPKWYQENFRNHWEKVIEKMDYISWRADFKLEMYADAMLDFRQSHI